MAPESLCPPASGEGPALEPKASWRQTSWEELWSPVLSIHASKTWQLRKESPWFKEPPECCDGFPVVKMETESLPLAFFVPIAWRPLGNPGITLQSSSVIMQTKITRESHKGHSLPETVRGRAGKVRGRQLPRRPTQILPPGSNSLPHCIHRNRRSDFILLPK